MSSIAVINLQNNLREEEGKNDNSNKAGVNHFKKLKTDCPHSLLEKCHDSSLCNYTTSTTWLGRKHFSGNYFLSLTLHNFCLV